MFSTSIRRVLGSSQDGFYDSSSNQISSFIELGGGGEVFRYRSMLKFPPEIFSQHNCLNKQKQVCTFTFKPFIWRHHVSLKPDSSPAVKVRKHMTALWCLQELHHNLCTLLWKHRLYVKRCLHVCLAPCVKQARFTKNHQQAQGETETFPKGLEPISVALHDSEEVILDWNVVLRKARGSVFVPVPLLTCRACFSWSRSHCRYDSRATCSSIASLVASQSVALFLSSSICCSIHDSSDVLMAFFIRDWSAYCPERDREWTQSQTETTKYWQYFHKDL